MIGFLRGAVFCREGSRVIIDVAGVGYEVFMPERDMHMLPGEGGEALVHVHTVFRDDSISLYGFASQERRSLFLMLLDVSGVGPKLALAILGALSSRDLLDALARGDVAALQSIHGVGKKTAARLCVDLKERASALFEQSGFIHDAPRGGPAVGVASGSVEADAVSALVNLGWREPDALKAVSSVLAESPSEPTLQELITGAMGRLAVKKGG